MRLAAAVEARESQLVLGLDPDPARLWPVAVDGASGSDPASRAADAVERHCIALIDAAGPACVMVKPQLACFERLGAAGRSALGAVVEHSHRSGLLVLADGKRGDIDVSAASYCKSLVGSTATPFGEVEGLGADAFTANPYMGRDTLDVLASGAREVGAGVFVLVRTSNPGAADFEDLQIEGGGALWERVAVAVDEMADEGTLSDVGAVVGATAPEHVARMRELMPRAVFLLPGVGAQGGKVEDLAPAFAPGRAAGLVSASRSIVFAFEEFGGDPADAARSQAESLRETAWALG
uniref:Orotidine 5'-phosphate decarboxylase n=1 Tax=freshwater metagenome TaxID=449393 RepID=A0A6J5ZU73_9ZZZZ